MATNNKIIKNWRERTLEDLENDYWGEIEYPTNLVRRCFELREIPLRDFRIEDLRIMISQQIGLDYLVPLALEVLTKDLFAEGDLFEGDLLKSTLRIKTSFWNNNKEHWATLYNLVKNRRNEIEVQKFDTINFDNCIHQL
ncbi:contact-dependent growth inhibition system immunity protein [Ferruginibacter sp.]